MRLSADAGAADIMARAEETVAVALAAPYVELPAVEFIPHVEMCNGVLLAATRGSDGLIHFRAEAEFGSIIADLLPFQAVAVSQWGLASANGAPL